MVPKRTRERNRGDGSRKATEHKTAIRVAYIGAAATLLAAVIGGVFVLASTSGQGSSGNSNPGGQPDLAILSVSFDRMQTEEIVNVTGVARNIPTYETVYAVAKPGANNVGAALPVASGANARSWFVGGPAIVGKDGLWSIKINVSPLQAGNLTIAAVEVGVPTVGCASGVPCVPSPLPPPPPALTRIQLGTYGPNSNSVTLTSSSKNVTIPAG